MIVDRHPSTAFTALTFQAFGREDPRVVLVFEDESDPFGRSVAVIGETAQAFDDGVLLDLDGDGARNLPRLALPVDVVHEAHPGAGQHFFHLHFCEFSF